MKAIVLSAAAGLAFGMAASLAHAQFAAPYPPLIELPPQPYPAPQKAASKPPQPARVAPQDRSPPELSRCYQGQTRIC